jgi:hypothetical protein
VLRLTFADGLTDEIDGLDRTHGPVFEQAVTPAGFAAVTADSKSGTVVWPEQYVQDWWESRKQSPQGNAAPD